MLLLRDLAKSLAIYHGGRSQLVLTGQIVQDKLRLLAQMGLSVNSSALLGTSFFREILFRHQESEEVIVFDPILLLFRVE